MTDYIKINSDNKLVDGILICRGLKVEAQRVPDVILAEKHRFNRVGTIKELGLLTNHEMNTVRTVLEQKGCANCGENVDIRDCVTVSTRMPNENGRIEEKDIVYCRSCGKKINSVSL